MKAVNQIEKHMTDYPSITSANASVTEAAALMQSCKIRHLPVVEEGKVIGVVSDRDLRQAELLSDFMQLIVSDVMTPDPYCVAVGTPLSTVAAEMARKKFGCTVVLNQLGRVVGIFTTTDGMRVLSELLVSEHPPDLRLFGIEQMLSREVLVSD